jgi:hypothetical protein
MFGGPLVPVGGALGLKFAAFGGPLEAGGLGGHLAPVGGAFGGPLVAGALGGPLTPAGTFGATEISSLISLPESLIRRDSCSIFVNLLVLVSSFISLFDSAEVSTFLFCLKVSNVFVIIAISSSSRRSFGFKPASIKSLCSSADYLVGFSSLNRLCKSI